MLRIQNLRGRGSSARWCGCVTAVSRTAPATLDPYPNREAEPTLGEDAIVHGLWATTVEVSWSGWDVVGLLTIPGFVALNGFFVAAEFALVAVRRTRVEELLGQGAKGAKALSSAVAHLDRSIAATQLGITLASLALGFVGERALEHLLHPLLHSLPTPWSSTVTHSLAWLLAFACITFLHVVFGELVPKTLALETPDRIALWVARPLLIFGWISRPIIVVMNNTGIYLLRLFGYKAMGGTDLVHSVEELALLIEDTEEAGVLDADEAELVQNVFELRTKHVRDCMVPREKMTAVELTMPLDKVLEIVRNTRHTRLPVYEGSVDCVVGIINSKDLFYLEHQPGLMMLEDATYPALFLKPDEEIANALRLFKRARRHMAVVRDEDGKVHGLITLEDILEEIIGDIEDEHDRPMRKVKRRRRK